ncbi:hypothetical protein H5T51_09600 [Candidatus Bathyarchaeota archaeon]|nr:hypothetical protein [Candidatus Bathyarchaeota archaeon]
MYLNGNFGGGFLPKKGEKYKCETCGLVVIVDEACGCSAHEIICCEAPMKKVKEK